MYNLGLYIFRRDLRIQNNMAFSHALKQCKQVLPIFIFTPEQVINNNFKSNKSVQFMIESLDDLDSDIALKNGNLYTFYGEIIDVIQFLIKNYGVDSIFVNTDYTPYSKSRDSKIETLCKKESVDFRYYHDVCLFKPGTITTENGVYKKFTPFYNKCLGLIKNIECPPLMKFKKNWCGKVLDNKYTISLNDAYISLTEPDNKSLLHGGRKDALQILKYIKNFKDYSEIRNMLSEETTHLSAYLKYGCISVKELLFILQKRGFGNNHDLIRQLIWRDFYIHILDAFPYVLKGVSFKPKYDSIVWDNDITLFNAWKTGNTGFPIVDACMRQLNTIGYMHNRGRLIVASFLIKTLFIDWRKGEKYFAQKLIDYDPAANNGNWQWVAGSGVDSQPYFRIFNPWSQSEKYDTDALYIKKWCPELSDVPAKDIHNWYKKYESYKHSVDYNSPIVDYTERRKYVLDKYAKYLK
jgi:deoxyribodipyrimidine photo-lyase